MKHFVLEKENLLHVDAKIGYKWVRVINNQEFNLDAFNYIFENNGITIWNIFRYIKYYKMNFLFPPFITNMSLNPRLKIHLKDSTILKTNDPIVYEKILNKDFKKNLL